MANILDGMEVTLYTVTLEKNIPGIIEAGGLSPEFGGSGGLAEAANNDDWIQNSKGKVFVSTHWAGVCNNVDYYMRKYEENEEMKPVVLRISIPLKINEDQDRYEGNSLLRNMMTDPDTPESGGPRLGAYYFTQMIPTDYITFAAYSTNEDFDDENIVNPAWEYKNLDEFWDSKAIFPDLPNPEIGLEKNDEDEEQNKTFDITEELHEAMKAAYAAQTD